MNQAPGAGSIARNVDPLDRLKERQREVEENRKESKRTEIDEEKIVRETESDERVRE